MATQLLVAVVGVEAAGGSCGPCRFRQKDNRCTLFDVEGHADGTRVQPCVAAENTARKTLEEVASVPGCGGPNPGGLF